MSKPVRRSGLIAFVLAATGALFFGLPADVSAQADLVWLDVGDFHYRYSSTGTEPAQRNPPIRSQIKFWPGIYHLEGGTHVRTRMYIGARDWTDDTGRLWPFKVSRTGPREFELGEHLGGTIELVGRFPKPEVFVDGFQSFLRPTVLTRVDPTIKADRIAIRSANADMGITWHNTIYAFSNEHHDDYHIREITFTNTGNVDADEEIELPDQTLNEVMFELAGKEHFWGPRRVTAQGGSATMWDYVGDGKEDYGEKWAGIRTMLGWLSHGTRTTFLNRIGSPTWRSVSSPPHAQGRIVEADTLGRLGAAYMIFHGTIHADTSPSDETNDMNQPAHTGWLRGGDPITDPTIYSESQYELTYSYLHPDMEYAEYGRPGIDGHEYPHSADRAAPVEPVGPWDSEQWLERMGNQTDLSAIAPGGGRCPSWATGPYTLGPGEDIKYVWASGMTGLYRDVAVHVGIEYKNSGWDDDHIIEYEGQAMTKNRWVLSTRDSVLSNLRKAEANWKSGFNIPHPPLPPSRFEVVSGSDKIALSWEVFPNADHTGFEIYRTRNLYESSAEDLWKYRLIAELPASARSYDDTEVVRGRDYFYYILSTGPVKTDPTGTSPPTALKSSRYYTQTYDPANLKRSPGSTLADVRIVPNPFVLEADQVIRWPDQQDKLAFFEIPGNCTIKIYSEVGELIHQIEHTDGTGDEFWNLTTESNQVIASGIYFAVIRDLDSNEKIVRKFAIIR